jgi:hypothetical protein
MTNTKNITAIDVLPIATIQPTFSEVLKDVESGLVPEDQFWLSLYKAGEESVHASVHTALDEVDRNKILYSIRVGEDITKDISFEEVSYTTFYLLQWVDNNIWMYATEV